mgnify:CR=1 FL=1
MTTKQITSKAKKLGERLEYFMVHDEETGLCLDIEAYSLDEALAISENLDFKKLTEAEIVLVPYKSGGGHK